MLSKSAIDLAAPLAESLAKNKVMLAGPGEDPITELARISLADTPDMLRVNMEATSSDVIGNIYDTCRRQEELLSGVTGCQHDNAIDEIKTNLSATVRNTVQLARHVAVPLINDCTAAAKEILDNRSKADLYPFNVEHYSFPEMSTSPVISDFVSNHAHTVLQDVNFISLPLTLEGGNPIEALMAHVSTGIERYDAVVASWIENNLSSAGTLFDAFTRSTNSLYAVVDMSGHRANERATFLYLLARKLMNDGPPSGVNMELLQWRSYISGVTAFAAAAMHQTFNRRVRDANNKRLVLRWPSEGAQGGTFVLNGDISDAWYSAGGDIESIFGAHFSNRDFGYDALLQNQAGNKAEWARQYQIYVKHSANNVETYTREALYGAIHPRLTAQFPSMVATDRLWNQCQSIGQKDTDNLYDTVRRIVCTAAFESTDVLSMLSLFDETAIEHPEADNREVALIATSRYVGKWIAGLVKPHSVA